MLSFILWIVGCAIVIPAMVYIFNKVMKNGATKKGGAMTKDRYNNIAARLLLITLLSTIVCVVINSYMPLIITGAVFIGFLIFARKRYGYKAIEPRELTKEERNASDDNSGISISPLHTWSISNINHED